MMHYCIQNGKLFQINEKMQDKYKMECLNKAEDMLKTANHLIELSGTLIQASHKYD
jgi:hypothetical protein